MLPMLARSGQLPLMLPTGQLCLPTGAPWQHTKAGCLWLFASVLQPLVIYGSSAINGKNNPDPHETSEASAARQATQATQKSNGCGEMPIIWLAREISIGFGKDANHLPCLALNDWESKNLLLRVVQTVLN